MTTIRSLYIRVVSAIVLHFTLHKITVLYKPQDLVYLFLLPSPIQKLWLIMILSQLQSKA